MSLLKHITHVMRDLKPAKNWDTIYWLVDVHGVIIPGSFHRKNEFKFMHPDAKDVLQWITKRSHHKLILWSSSYKTEIDELKGWLFEHGIKVDYVNENPAEEHSNYADFSKKPYFNILLDDKAGFDTLVYWTLIKEYLKFYDKEFGII